MKPLFNYIVPVFNKQDILPMTLNGLDKCASHESRILIVIDGCTDNSERIVDEFKARTNRNIEKIYMPDVHMLRSVNAALKVVTSGYSVVMQDDIVLKEPNFEEKITNLYEKMGSRLGVVSLRLASNVRSNTLLNRLRMRNIDPMIEEFDFIIKSGEPQNFLLGNNESFYPRMSAINGPNIIPWDVRQKVGIFDEMLAPYGYDDPDYCLRAMKLGYVNGLFPLNFRSDIDWGGTRRSKAYLKQVKNIHARNRLYLWKKHGDYIKSISHNLSSLSKTTPEDCLDRIPDFSAC